MRDALGDLLGGNVYAGMVEPGTEASYVRPLADARALEDSESERGSLLAVIRALAPDLYELFSLREWGAGRRAGRPTSYHTSPGRARSAGARHLGVHFWHLARDNSSGTRRLEGYGFPAGLPDDDHHNADRPANAAAPVCSGEREHRYEGANPMNDTAPPGYGTATVADVVAALENLRASTPVLLELGAGMLGGPLGAPVQGLGMPLTTAPEHYALLAGEAPANDDDGRFVHLVCIGPGAGLTVGELLDRLAEVRSETPFVLALPGGSVAGPASWPQVIQGAPLAGVEGHYTLQPGAGESRVAVVVLGLPANTPASIAA